MRPARRATLRLGLICGVGFLTSTLTPNIFNPDICSSQGYGFPFPTYISWCECVTDQPAFYPFVLAGYLIFWIAVFCFCSFIARNSKLPEAPLRERETGR